MRLQSFVLTSARPQTTRAFQSRNSHSILTKSGNGLYRFLLRNPLKSGTPIQHSVSFPLQTSSSQVPRTRNSSGTSIAIHQAAICRRLAARDTFSTAIMNETKKELDCMNKERSEERRV